MVPDLNLLGGDANFPLAVDNTFNSATSAPLCGTLVAHQAPLDSDDDFDMHLAEVADWALRTTVTLTLFLTLPLPLLGLPGYVPHPAGPLWSPSGNWPIANLA